MNNSKTLAYVFVGVAALLVIFAVYKTLSKAPSSTVTPASQVGEQEPTVPVLPTLTQEEREIISKIETLQVEITDKTVEPATITVKQHDQVQFYNRSSQTIAVDGGDWGKVPLMPGENLTQAFKTVGTFKYTVTGVDLSGEVVVK